MLQLLRWAWLPTCVLVLGGAGCSGSDGKNGANGANGTNGNNGQDGVSGQNGEAGAPATITGTIAATVTDSKGAALAGATVVTLPSGATGTTDAMGHATLANLPIGVYAVNATATGFKIGHETDVAVGSAQTVPVTFALAAGTEFALARVVGIPDGFTDNLPGNEVRMTLAKPYVNIVPNGLPNVAVGAYAYLKGAAVDSGGKNVTAWAWTVTPPPTSKATLEYWDGTSVTGQNVRTWQGTTPYQDARIRTDVVGTYVVKTTVTSAAGTSSSTLAITAGTYVGAQTCMSCHNNEYVVGKYNAVYDDWLGTGHASKFDASYGMYTSYVPLGVNYCVSCHTTGYNESTKAFGFDAMSKLAGWDPTAQPQMNWMVSKWPTLASMTSDPVSAPMQKLKNIQCEQCHGPGSSHPTAASHMSWDPAVCGQCHSQQTQWATSKHATPIAGSMWDGNTDCMPCHSGQGFVASWIQGKPLVTPDMAYDGNPPTVFPRGQTQMLGCATCHDPHKATDPHSSTAPKGFNSAQLRGEGADIVAPMGFTLSGLKESWVCNRCHTNKRDKAYFQGFLAGKQARATHANTQGDMFAGKGGYEYANKTYAASPHTGLIQNECVTCHMYSETTATACSAQQPCAQPYQTCSHGKCADQGFGGHTYAMTYTDKNSTVYQHVSACNQQGCHGGKVTTFDRTASLDLDGDGTIEGVQTELKGLFTALEAKLVKDANNKLYESTFDKANNLAAKDYQAYWNYYFVKSDASLGIHNTKYAAQLLCDSLKDLDPNAKCNRP